MTCSVSVLIPAHNEAEHIEAVLAAISAQTRPVDQVLVVADACTDDTAQLARAAGAEVMEVECARKSAAQNLGLAAVRSEVVVGVDADTLLAPDAIALMVEDLSAGYDGTCAAVLPRQERGVWVRARWFDYTLARRWIRPVQREVGRMHVLSGACYAFRTEVMRAAGGLRDVPAGEDTDLTWTLYGQGRRLTYTPAAVAYTTEPESFTVYLRQIRRWSASCFQTIARHRRQCSQPARALVVGTMLWDLLSFPVGYAFVAWAVLNEQSWGHLFGAWTVLVWGLPTLLVSRDLGWRRAVACLPAHILAGAVNRWVYLTTMLREWLLGRHYVSWTGRQGRGTVITPMTRQRRIGLAGTSACLAALSLGVWLLQPGVSEGPTVALTQVPGLPPVIPPAATVTPARGELEKVVVPAADTQPAATAPNPLPAPATPPVVSARRTLPSTMRQPAMTSTSLLAAPEDAPVAATEGVPPVAPIGQPVPAEAERPATTVPAVPSPEEAEREDEPEEARRAKQERRGAEIDLAKDILKEAERRHDERKGMNGGEDESTEQMPERSQG